MRFRSRVKRGCVRSLWTSDLLAAAGVLGAEDSLDDLGIELDLESLDGDEEDLDEDVVTTDEEQEETALPDDDLIEVDGDVDLQSLASEEPAE